MNRKDNRNAVLGDLYQFQYGTGNTIEDIGGDYPIYGSNGAVGFTNIYNSEDAPVIGHIGAYAGIVNWASGKHFVTYNGVICKIKDGVNPKFGYYSLLNSGLQKRLRGSTQPFVSYDLLDEVKTYLPDKKIQDNIANTLSEIDAKIELNNKINSELEQMAKTLYDYWFVQFDFPDENGKPYKSSGGEMVLNKELKRKIPKDWEVKRLKDILPVITGKKDANFASTNGQYNFFTCGEEILKCDSYEFEGKAVLVAGNGNFNIKLYDGKFNAYQRTYILIPSEKKYYTLVYMAVRDRIASLTKGSRGSIVKFITKGDLEDIQIPLPKDRNLNVFSQLNTITKKIEKNLEENQQLGELRDWLLPMLMNGQVSIK
ncbi:MAG TPA: restriction endonuclease subunit S [Gallicola sp.]|nr:restriction endonuclease subunit S [Gallicola sp.]